ncbi:nickel pincer cofactor biosynthesis protein LarC [Methanomethylophilus alvi]|uniref:nickel pincer cofactor biosynthesis protein LarC n=1 Tax=Methanomethylophilus alvi TaxID=1291540 RepID=UPI0037DCA7FC
MKTLYLECNAGASGDMILGSLTDLLKDPFEFKQMIECAGIPGITAEVTVDDQSSVAGIRVHIMVDGIEEGSKEESGHHDHHALKDVISIIGGLNVSDMVKSDAAQIYRIIAEAESNVHGKPVNEVHFHEVGALDAIADIVGVCMLIEKLAPEQIIASPLRTGFGTVSCAHGILPVPAPATAYILQGMPVYAGDEEGEFTTPTGAAIVKHFAEAYGQMPLMKFDDVGYGLGRKSFKTANMVRTYLGDVDEALPTVKEISCNIDDMTPEDIGGIIDLLMSAGALDAMITSAMMKKSRPGYILTCICREEDADELATVMLAHTSSIGLRMHTCERYEMGSSFITYRTDFGDVRIKVSEGYGLRKWKPEHEDMVKAAISSGVTVDEVRKSIHFDPDEEIGDD